MPPILNGITEILNVLKQYLPSTTPSVPGDNVSLVKVEERAIGIGSHCQNLSANPSALNMPRKGYLDAVVCFQFWSTELETADKLVDELHGKLLADKEKLRSQGFLRTAPKETSLAEFVPTLNAWRKTAHYEVLYEFEEQPDAGDAQSLITEIPITIGDRLSESTTITDRGE